MSKRKNRLQSLDRFIELPGDGATGDDNLPLLAELVGAEIISEEGSKILRIVDEHELFPYSTIKEVSDHLIPDLYRGWHFVTGGEDISFDPARFVFFDTETTGLSGGAGILAFLIGFGYFEDGAFKVVQYFLPDYPDESMLLDYALRHIKEDSVLVSYNGKAYDWPLLKQRFTINRIDEPPFAGHLDSLHPARSLFRRLGEDCSLITLEKNLLAFDRGEDIPGYLIPAKYFDYLYDRQPGMIPEIIRHNRLDIISLALVTRFIPEIITRPERVNSAALLEGVINHFYRNKLFKPLISYLERVTPGYIDECSAVSLLQYSLTLKREGEIDRARAIWQKAAAGESGPEIYGHLMELAKYQEHRQKDPFAALETVELILEMDLTPARLKSLVHRRIRLEEKCRKTSSKSL